MVETELTRGYINGFSNGYMMMDGYLSLDLDDEDNLIVKATKKYTNGFYVLLDRYNIPNYKISKYFAFPESDVAYNNVGVQDAILRYIDICDTEFTKAFKNAKFINEDEEALLKSSFVYLICFMVGNIIKHVQESDFEDIFGDGTIDVKAGMLEEIYMNFSSLFSFMNFSIYNNDDIQYMISLGGYKKLKSAITEIKYKLRREIKSKNKSSIDLTKTI